MFPGMGCGNMQTCWGGAAVFGLPASLGEHAGGLVINFRLITAKKQRSKPVSSTGNHIGIAANRWALLKTVRCLGVLKTV